MSKTEKFAALKKAGQGGWWEFAHNKSPKCPHCGDDYDAFGNEAWELYDDNDSHDVECNGCNNEFSVSTYTEHTFGTDEQDAYVEEPADV